ncbi:MAG TPA: carboxypeptidase regulatory-like domain-containing protein [Bryobacteraceae bacterium]|nr:carboxypeptidase regulatory-like domain-containing protein [Bryobacteraceae bacterium]
MSRSLLCAVLLLAGASLSDAQTVQGVVTGSVFDTTGAIIPGSDVVLTNVDTAVNQTTKGNASGEYRFSLVPPGMYKLDVKANGFTEKQITNIKVDASETVPVNVTLAVASATTSVEVEASAALVQTASSDLATTVNTRTIDSMPLLTRNVFDLAFVAPATTQGMNFNVAAGGVRESGTTNMLNGADNNDNFSEGSYNVQPPLESVSEFTVLTNSMSAQYGHAAGALVSAIQKSGTNKYHGAAYEFNRNTDFNASTFFDNRAGNPNPEYIRNQFGGEVDGPIKKDKTFFMASYDRLDLHQGNTIVSTVMTPAELSTITTGAGPIATAYLKQFPPLTSNALCPSEADFYPDAIGHLGCVNIFDPILTGQNTYVGRIDQNFSEKNRLSFTANVQRYGYNDKWGGGHPTTSANIPYQDNEHYHNLSLVDTNVFSPSLLNELTVAHNRHYSVNLANNGQATSPEIYLDDANYDGLSTGFGPYEGELVEGFVQDRWQFQDNLTWSKGAHTFKFGGGFQYGILYRNWDLGSPGLYEFANTLGPTAASVGASTPSGIINNVENYPDSNFQHDFPYYSELSINPSTGGPATAYKHYIMKDTNFFVNDDWKVSPKLTLNLGLRWERYGAPTEANNEIAQFTNLNGYDPASVAAARVGPVTSMWKTPNKDFGPRVGFAFDPFGDHKTAIRGGYGISYDRLFDNIWSNGAWNPPYYALLDHDATAGDDISYTLPPSIAGYTAGSIPGVPGTANCCSRVSVRTMDVHMKDSSVENYYLGVERQFWQNFLLRVNYQGSFGRHLSQLMNLNRFDGSEYNPTLSTANSRPNPLYSGFNYRANNLNSNYNALVTEVQKRYSNGLQFQFSFTWSRLMDQGSDLFTGSTSTGAYSQPFYFVSDSHPNLEYGPGAFDHQKNFKVILTYELPFLKDQKGFAGRVFGGWQLSGFYQGYSGHPIDVYNSRGRYVGNALDPNGYPENIGGDYNLDGVGNDRPDFVGASASAVYSHSSAANGIFTDGNEIGCGFTGSKSTNIAACNASYGVTTPNSLFVNPTGYGVHFGTLGRNLFRGPWFNGLDGALLKNFKIAETVHLQLRFEALNLLNHPNFDGIDTNVNAGDFGVANLLVGGAPSRRLQLGGRVTF